MCADLNKDLEEVFAQRNEVLRSFYDAGADKLSEEELHSLTPILNSLKDRRDRYRELEDIAEGGEKRITMVYDNCLDRKVAVARAVRAETLQDQEQFLREARLTANLAHPNIMPVYNMGLDGNGVPFFSMELVMGDTLKVILTKLKDGDDDYKRKYTLEVLLNIYVKLCDAIAYAHSRNVLHLDIKPDNIKVGEFGEVFVCDWGLARVMNRPDDATHIDEGLDADVLNDMTLSGTMKGTPGFMAPEQTHAYSAKSMRTDIYALGAVLYNILTYELPVRGNTAQEVVQNTREGNIIPPTKRRPDMVMPNSLVAVALKTISLEPNDRYLSVRDLQDDINKYLNGKATSAENASALTSAALWIQRHRWITVTILISILILVMFSVLHMLSISEQNEKLLEANQRGVRNFQLFQESMMEAKKLKRNLDEAVSYTVKSRDFVNAASMIEVLELGLTEKLDANTRHNLLTQKGKLHFILQQFNAASVCFGMTNADPKSHTLLSLCQKYAEIKPKDNRQLSDKNLAKLLYSFSDKEDDNILYYLYYHHMRLKKDIKPLEHSHLVGAMLDRMNNVKYAEKDPLRITKTPKGYQLDLSYAPYHTYTLNLIGVFNRNVLSTLELYSLDISHTPLRKFTELQNLNANKLILYGVKLPKQPTYFISLMKKANIKEISIDKDAFNANQINTIKKSLKVQAN